MQVSCKYIHYNKAIAIALIGLTALMTTSSVSASKPQINAGTLTCTSTSERFSGRKLTQALSCEYQPIGRAKATFTGKVKRFGRNANIAAIGTLKWNVLAPTPNIEPQSISGTYKPSTVVLGGRFNGRFDGLIGGWNNSIRLKQVTDVHTAALKNAADSILEIELVAVRV